MATKGYGTTLSYGNNATYAASTTWTALTKILSIEPPAPEADDIDTTEIASADEHREFEPGWADGGEAKFTVKWDETQSVAIYGLFRTMKGWKVLLAGSAGLIGFSGYIKAIGTPIDEEGIVTNEITIKITGKVVIDAVA